MAHILASSVVVSPGHSTPELARLCSPVGCVPLQVVERALVASVSAVGLFALLAVGLTYLPDARDRVTEEIRRTRAERDAFDAFADRVLDVDAAAPQRRVQGGTVLHARGGTDAATTANVREAYRETVMAVDHYPEEYDESLAVNMEVEFGPEVTTAVTEDQPVAPPLQHALVEQASSAVTARESLLGELDAEAEELADAETTLEEVAEAIAEHESFVEQWPFPLLSDTYWELRDLEETCRDLLADRQASIAGDDSFEGRNDAFDLHEYLYEPLPVRHPVLAEGSGLVERCRTAQRDVAGAMSR